MFSHCAVTLSKCHGTEMVIMRNRLHIHSGYFYSTSSSPLLLRVTPDSTDNVSEFCAEAPQATASEGLVQGPYVAPRAGFEPMTSRTKGDESINEPHAPYFVK